MRLNVKHTLRSAMHSVIISECVGLDDDDDQDDDSVDMTFHRIGTPEYSTRSNSASQ